MQKPTKLFPREHSIAIYHHSPEFGVTFTDCLQNSYWAHVAAQLRPGTKIELLAPDMSWYGVVIVRSATRTEAVVSALHFTELEAAKPARAPENPYKIEWGGPSHKYRIVRLEDGEVISKEHGTQEVADKWLTNHLKAQAA